MVSYIHLTPSLFFVTTDEGTLLEANENLCKNLAYKPNEIIGGKVEHIFTLSTRIFQQTHIFPLLKLHGHADEIYITLLQKSGKHVPVLMNANRQSVNDMWVIVYNCIVVENRKKFEDELIAAKKAAEAALNENTALIKARQELLKRTESLEKQMQIVAKQNEELRQFDRVVTHDLREPLRKLSVFTSILEDGTAARIPAIGEKLRRQILQMSTIVSGLQQYVWLHEAPLKLTKINLEALLEGIIEQLKVDTTNTELELHLPTFIQFEADPEQMQLLFRELISNAIRYKKPGHKAYVSINATILQHNTFQNVADVYKWDDFLRLQVIDKGIGFDANYKQQAFELFKKLHKESGIGIGLSLCKQVVVNHNGRIEIESMEDEGTTVTILLPINRSVTSS